MKFYYYLCVTVTNEGHWEHRFVESNEKDISSCVDEKIYPITKARYYNSPPLYRTMNII